MVLSVRIRIQCGMGLFCLIFLASFFLIINVLCDGCSIIIYIKTNKKPQLKLSQLHNQRERDRESVCVSYHFRFFVRSAAAKTLIVKS